MNDFSILNIDLNSYLLMTEPAGFASNTGAAAQSRAPVSTNAGTAPSATAWSRCSRHRCPWCAHIWTNMYMTGMHISKFHHNRGEYRALTYRSNVSSSSWLRSQAMYSSEASVIRGHQDRSRARSFCRFSAISSTPSSVTLLQPDSDSTVRWGSECTTMLNAIGTVVYYTGVWSVIYLFKSI